MKTHSHRLVSINANVSAMSSGGLRETMYQTTQSLRAWQVA